MNRRKLGIFALMLFAILVSVGVVSAQEEAAATPETQEQMPPPPAGQPQPPPDGEPVTPPDGEPVTPPDGEPVIPPDGQPQPPDGQSPQPPDGQSPQRPNGQPFPRQAPRQWQYVQSTTTTTATASTVYPSQVLLLRHIEQTIADALGLTRSDVNTLRLTMTFDEVVTTYGGDANLVRSQALIDLQAWIAEGMSDGTISQARGQLILNNLSEIVDRAFTGAFNVNGSTVIGLLDS